MRLAHRSRVASQSRQRLGCAACVLPTPCVFRHHAKPGTTRLRLQPLQRCSTRRISPRTHSQSTADSFQAAALPAAAPVAAPLPGIPSKDALQQAIQAALDPSNADPFPWSLQELCASLQTSLTSGQPNNEAHLACQRSQFGANWLPEARAVTFWELVVDALGDFTLLMLLVAGAVSLLLAFLVPGAEPEDWIEGAAILASAAVVVLVAATTNFQKEIKFRELNSIKDDVEVRVVRGGRERRISVRDVVVGDIVVVEGGDILPADGLLLPSGQLKLDESHLTGESEDVIKGGCSEGGLDSDGRAPVVYSGSKVLEGFGRVLVLAVGVSSQQGMIGSLVMSGGGTADTPGQGAGNEGAAGGAAEGQGQGQGQVVGLQEDTLLVQKLDSLAKAIGGVGVAAAGGVLAMNLGGLAWDLALKGEPLLAVNHLQEYLSCVLNAITVLVVAVPEGLPLAVTLALAFSVQRMLADNTLVRHLAACETMASTTTILSDKTGTLTENNMRVVRLWAGGASFRVRPSSHPSGPPAPPTSAPIRGPPSAPPGPSGLLRPLARPSARPAHASLTMVSLSVDESDPRLSLPAPPTNTNAAAATAAAAAATAASVTTAVLEAPAAQTPQDLRPWPSSNRSLPELGEVVRQGGLPLPRALVDPLLMNITLNSTASVQVASRRGTASSSSSSSGGSSSFDGSGGTGTGASGSKRLDMAGNRTECALLEFAMRLDPALLRIDSLRRQYDILQVLPFTSTRKSMTTAVVPTQPLLGANGSSGGQTGAAQVFTKGAGEVVLKRCHWQLDAEGNTVPLAEAQKQQILDSFSREGLRVLALASKLTSAQQAGAPAEQLEEAMASGLVLLGVVGLEDPLRRDVPLSVARCQRAGITVRMLTGDNPVTAVAIARQCGILPAALGIDDALAVSRAVRKVDGRVVGLPAGRLGEEPAPLAIEAARLRELITRPGGKLDEKALLAVWPHLRVVARCTPTDKYLLVAGVKKLRGKGLLHEVVAVTGDGTNDAPALRAADVGFAMNSGTGIAKEAADILLMDDSFSSVVAAARWGRNVYAGISRFLQFQLTANVVAVSTAAMGAVFLRESPLTAVQMLWVNLIMDSLASLALATESPTDELLECPPVGVDQPLVSPDVAKHIGGQAVLQLAVMALLVLKGEALLGVDKATAHTLVFNTFVWLQLFNQVNCRRVRDEPNPFQGVLHSPLFVSIWVVEAALQVLIVECGGKAFQTVPLEPHYWVACLSVGALSLLARTALRRVPSPTFRPAP